MSTSASFNLFVSVLSHASFSFVLGLYQELICIYFSHGSRIDTNVSALVAHFFMVHTVSIISVHL